MGFPVARIAVIFLLSYGAVFDLAISRYAEKGQGESTLFRTIWDVFRSNDVVLTDALHCTSTEILMLKERGVDFVGQLHVMRSANFRREKRLGMKDHIVSWPKPFVRWMDKQSRKPPPEFLEDRECCISI